MSSNLLHPHKPQNIRVAGFTDTSIQLEWDAVEGANSYYIYTDSASAPFEATGTTYMLTGLEPKTFYNIQISAYNGYVEGAKSEELSQKTKVEPAVLQTFKIGDPYLLGTAPIGESITSCRLYNADGSRYITTGTVTNGALKIYLNNNVNIVEGEQYTVKVVDGDPKTVPLLSDSEGMPVTFTVLPAA